MNRKSKKNLGGRQSGKKDWRRSVYCYVTETSCSDAKMWSKHGATARSHNKMTSYCNSYHQFRTRSWREETNKIKSVTRTLEWVLSKWYINSKRKRTTSCTLRVSSSLSKTKSLILQPRVWMKARKSDLKCRTKKMRLHLEPPLCRLLNVITRRSVAFFKARALTNK
jgi:hypothetical protein